METASNTTAIIAAVILVIGLTIIFISMWKSIK